MKKLLLTIFTVAMLVACNKDAFDQDVENINVLDQTEISSDISGIDANLDIDVDAITERLEGIASRMKSFDRKDRSTARTAGGYIKLSSGASNGIYYEFVYSDDVLLCNEASHSFLEEIFLVLNSSNETEIRLIAPSGGDSILVSTITTDFSFLFAITITEGLRVNLADGSYNLVNGQGTPSFTFGSETFAFNCDGTYYSITPAPFPLRGFLATIIDGALPTGMSSSNYAGTDEAAVKAAIENDIRN